MPGAEVNLPAGQDFFAARGRLPGARQLGLTRRGGGAHHRRERAKLLFVVGAVACVSLGRLSLAGAAPAVSPKVIVIGIDGVSLNLLEPFAEAGVTPNLAALMAQGARGDLASIWPLRTPQVWTSAATGKLPGQHGIWDHVSNSYFNPPEVRTQAAKRVTSADRRSKALWTLLSEQGKRSLVVGWMATWPAQPAPGVTMVAPVELVGDKRQTTIKGSFWRDAQGQVAPAALWPAVKALITEPQDLQAAELAAFADLPPADSPLYGLKYLKRYVYGLSWSLARAKSVEQITVGLLDDTQPDLVMSYFQCPDSLLHRFWIFRKPVTEIRERLQTHGLPTASAAELHRRFSRVVEACYRDVDARVGRILRAARGPETLVVVVSDHGFGDASKPHRMKGEPYSGDHRDDGVIIAAGPGIAAGSRIEGASILDVTPTVLRAMGIPEATDMRGRVLTAVATGAPTDGLTPVETYEGQPQHAVLYPDGYPKRPTD